MCDYKRLRFSMYFFLLTLGESDDRPKGHEPKEILCIISIIQYSFLWQQPNRRLEIKEEKEISYEREIEPL